MKIKNKVSKKNVIEEKNKERQKIFQRKQQQLNINLYINLIV